VRFDWNFWDRKLGDAGKVIIFYASLLNSDMKIYKYDFADIKRFQDRSIKISSEKLTMRVFEHRTKRNGIWLVGGKCQPFDSIIGFLKIN
jgi:hypothetical protein